MLGPQAASGPGDRPPSPGGRPSIRDRGHRQLTASWPSRMYPTNLDRTPVKTILWGTFKPGTASAAGLVSASANRNDAADRHARSASPGRPSLHAVVCDWIFPHRHSRDRNSAARASGSHARTAIYRKPPPNRFPHRGCNSPASLSERAIHCVHSRKQSDFLVEKSNYYPRASKKANPCFSRERQSTNHGLRDQTSVS